MDTAFNLINKKARVLGFLLYVVGVVWVGLLSQEELNFPTYLSENALLVGFVDELFRADNEIFATFDKFNNSVADKVATAALLRQEMEAAGLEFYEQNFVYSHKLLKSVGNISGTNYYAIMRSRSGSRTEAVVVTAPLRSTGESESPSVGSYAYLISIAKQLRTQLHWAKDVIFLFPDMEYIGLLAWLDEYHGVRTTNLVKGNRLIGRSGSLQAGINIEFPGLRMGRLDVSYNGINGESPNLDLINTVAKLAQKIGLPLSLHGQLQIIGGTNRQLLLDQLISSIWLQASCSPSGLHAPFINFQVPMITLRGSVSVHKATLDDLSRVGRLIEATLRCLNNLQERFHQSFYYYLLPNLRFYISIGVYLVPYFVALAGIVIQVVVHYADLVNPNTETVKKKECKTNKSANKESGERRESSSPANKNARDTEATETVVRKRTKKREASPKAWPSKPTESSPTTEPKQTNLISATLSALASLCLCFAAGGFVHYFPEYLYSYLTEKADAEKVWELSERYFITVFFVLFTVISMILPILAVTFKSSWLGYNQDWRISRALFLLLWATFLGCLSPLNFSTAFLLLLVMEPVLLIVNFCTNRFPRVLCRLLMLLVSPPVLIISASLLNPLITQFPPAPTHPLTDLGVINLRACGKLLMQAHMEAGLLGSWSWRIGTVFFLPLWLFTWNGLLLADS